MPALRVAVVDDHPFIVKVMTMAIESDAGLELAGVAETAEAALADLPAMRADVVLLDHHLRGETGGAELIAQLRTAGVDGRVLLFTADGEVAARALDAGADGAISKRNGPAVVCDAIRRVAAGETVLEGPDA
jgi:two-component system nitrate/nitrite response regulator NarL